MIALLIVATLMTPARPFEVAWGMRWPPPIRTSVHSRRFDTAMDAVKFAGRARMCSANQVPCVEWVSVYVLKYDTTIIDARLR